MKIKFATPDVGTEESSLIDKTISTRWIAKGKNVKAFEERIAHMSQCAKAVAFDSCTGAMEMSLRVLGIGPGDEVITTPFTYSATAEVIRNVGAKIVFVDLADDSFEMNYCKVAEAITENTKAVIPVDIGGKLCDYDFLRKVLQLKSGVFKSNNPLQKSIGRVAIVADAAHSFTAMQDGLYSGSFADFTCYSFHVLKNITTGGEGGAVVWSRFEGIDNEELETMFRLLGDHGQTSRDKTGGWEYDIALFGYNSIMTDIDAAMGVAQLLRFDEIRQKRFDVTCRYDVLFECECPEVRPLIKHFGPGYASAMHLYPIELPEPFNCEEGRNEVYKRLAEAGIPCNVHYKPLPMMTAYKSIGFDIGNYQNAYNRYKGLLTIPYHTELTGEEQEYIVRQIRKAVREK